MEGGSAKSEFTIKRVLTKHMMRWEGGEKGSNSSDFNYGWPLISLLLLRAHGPKLVFGLVNIGMNKVKKIEAKAFAVCDTLPCF